MKVKRCPICLGELLNAGDVCPRCGKVHYSITGGGVSVYDRERKKYIGTNQIIYVTDFFFAYDKGSVNALTAGGASGFGIAGALVGGLADEAIHAVKSSTKKTSTAVCYFWRDVVSLAYPAEPIQTQFLGRQGSNKIGGRGIDMRLRDGTWLTIGVPGFGKESAKDLYQVMNALHQNSIAQSSVNQRLEPQKHNASSDAGVAFCPNCGNRQEAGSKFCAQCGQKMATEPPKERNCPYCGAKVKEGMLFCMECGTKL